MLTPRHLKELWGNPGGSLGTALGTAPRAPGRLDHPSFEAVREPGNDRPSVIFFLLSIPEADADCGRRASSSAAAPGGFGGCRGGVGCGVRTCTHRLKAGL